MHGYEIRILSDSHKTAALIAVVEANDVGAILSAQRFSRGKPVEVWHDLDCIYRSDGAGVNGNNGRRPPMAWLAPQCGGLEQAHYRKTEGNPTTHPL